MAAPKGNRFWEARSSHGRKPIFSDPEQIAEAAVEYFRWAEENPLWESRVFHNSGEIVTASVPKMRAMSIMGLCNFLDIGFQTWQDYKQRDGFSDVCARVEQAIRQQKFEGASADLLNASIIARDLGLSEKTEHTGKDGERLIPEVSDEEIARRAAFLLAKGVQGKDSEEEG